MFKKITLFIVLLLLFTSCSSDYEKKLKISTTTWIGYAPLFYAKEKGWLDSINIKLLHVSSLSENMYLYKAKKSDAYVGTQYEYDLLKEENPSLKPIMMFDRSNGGDIIMTNRSIKELQNTRKKIDTYLEMDSINYTLLQDFLSKYSIESSQINYINLDQNQIALLEAKKTSKPTIIVTYIPYNNSLKKNGYKEIASTKDELTLLVVDAMFTTSKTFHKHEKQFIELKKLIDKSIVVLKNDPKEFYETIKPYMLDISYSEFKDSLNDIIWINKKLSKKLKKRMSDANFPIRDLI